MRFQRRLANRRLEGVSTDRLCTRPFIEWRALRRLRAGENDQTVMFERNGVFQRDIPPRELAESDVVIGFDTSSWLIAERALGIGRRFVLDQSIGHSLSYERLFPKLTQQFPEWTEDLPPRLPQFVLAQQAEHRLAHRIVVASSFARRSLIENGVAAEKISIIPFGVDLHTFSPIGKPDLSRPLRFLFLGSLGPRKGVPLLLQAWRQLLPAGAELWLAGSLNDRDARLIPSLSGMRMIGKVPRQRVPALLRECDVLVLPSYLEGLALVQLEALASGLPIIATEATGAPDLIINGVEGYIIPVGDVEALREALLRGALLMGRIWRPLDRVPTTSRMTLSLSQILWGRFSRANAKREDATF
jgi:alpha-maltose-1-phosphate synthase